jgi:hypothetical protein
VPVDLALLGVNVGPDSLQSISTYALAVQLQ